MRKIFLDAGHGGSDPGASNNTIHEKDIALKITLKLNDILKKGGFQTELSRTTDVFIALSERAKKANNFGSDVFVSIHLNSAANKTANGIETLVYENKGTNNKLASSIQNELITATNATNRGIKERCDLVVLNSTKMPAVLIETGFLSNKTEKNLLVTETYQNKIAQAIANGILQYLGKAVESVSEIKNVDEALKILQDKGIVNSPEYWLKAVDTVKYLDSLILNMANKLN